MNVKLFVNENEPSKATASKLTKILNKHHLKVDETEYEVAISIGGAGAFLRMIRETNFNPNINYVGIHTGTLGFLPEVLPNELEEFVKFLKNGNYQISEIGVLETVVECKDEILHLEAFNEIVVRDLEQNVTTLDIQIENELLERFKGDGILISTSIGSTAYNLSFGGSIVYFKLHTLQLTPIAPITSSRYHSLRNSIIIPEYIPIKLESVEKPDLLITIDGENKILKNMKRIQTKVGSKKIKQIRFHNAPFATIIHEKFLK